MGSLEGVRSTRAAWLGEHEVVQVLYDPKRLSYDALLAKAIERSCDRRVFATSDAQLATARARVGDRAVEFDPNAVGVLRDVEPSERLYYLGRSHLRFLPLTPVQARQVNAALGAKALGAEVAGTNEDPEAFLSPRQRAVAKRVLVALQRDPAALAGLVRPDEVAALAAYSDRLERALESGK